MSICVVKDVNTLYKILVSVTVVVFIALVTLSTHANSNEENLYLACQQQKSQLVAADQENNIGVNKNNSSNSNRGNFKVKFGGQITNTSSKCISNDQLSSHADQFDSATQLLADGSDLAVPVEGGNCHAHIEYFSASTVNVIYGADVRETDDVSSLYKALARPTKDANYFIHCQVFGRDTELTGYTVVGEN